jgi:formylglycine-generating enzyme required for sulfatase activity
MLSLWFDLIVLEPIPVEEDNMNILWKILAVMVVMTMFVTALAGCGTPAEPVAGATQFWEEDGSTMVYVPAGEFTMGSPEGEGNDDEHPQHTAYLSEFWIDQTEVTNEQYGRCVASGECEASEYADDDLFNGADQPVVGVSWHDSKAYCEWAGKQLPTEAQWEKATRGTDGRKYPWGNIFDGSKLNFCDANCDIGLKDSDADDGYQYTAPVGSYPAGASPYGVLDMAGNVWEWCQDRYDEDYYADSPQSDPRGPNSGENRVVRGGSWRSYEGGVRAAFRGGGGPVGREHFLGFRCVSLSP